MFEENGHVTLMITDETFDLLSHFWERIVYEETDAVTYDELIEILLLYFNYDQFKSRPR